MSLHEHLEKAWLAEGRFRTTHRTLTFTDQGLELGNGTLLVKYIQDDWDRRSLDIDGQEERILALLSVAWDHPMPDGILQHFHSASRALAKGERYPWPASTSLIPACSRWITILIASACCLWLTAFSTPVSRATSYEKRGDWDAATSGSSIQTATRLEIVAAVSSHRTTAGVAEPLYPRIKASYIKSVT